MEKRQSVLRLFDANANRALEGVRVCEEILRFFIESPSLFYRIRKLRHAIARVVSQLPVSAVDLVKSRDSRKDIGRRAPASSIDSIEHLLLINFQRTKESLRVLEECTRLLSPSHTAAFQRLRFFTYEVERETLLRVAALRHR